MKLTPEQRETLAALLRDSEPAPQPAGLVSAFSLDPSGEDDDCVVLAGKVFEAGDYPDKGVAFTEEDLDRAASGFRPVKNDLEHLPHLGVRTILDGKLGVLSSVRREGSDLLGEVRVPKWLHRIAGLGPLKVSLAFDAAKRIVGNALVLNPRISDAEVVAAFTASSPSIAPPVPTEPVRNEKPKPMKTLFATIAALFSAAAEVDPDEKPGVTPTDPKPAPGEPDKAAPSPEDKDAQIARLKAELEAEKAKAVPRDETRLAEKAAAFADDLIREGKAYPAEREAMATAFAAAVRADSTGSATCFSADGQVLEGVAVKALRGIYEARPAHGLTTDSTGAKSVVFAAGNPEVEGMTPERRKELLATTSLGSTLLQEGK